MLIEKMINTIKEYPKLYEVYLNKLADNYSVQKIDISAYKPSFMDATVIDLHMANLREEFILITYIQYKDSETVTIKQRSEDSIKGKIHPQLYMSADILGNTDFKNQFIGGYNKKDVDDLLDWLQKDYSYIENVLINQNKILKDDIKKLRS